MISAAWMASGVYHCSPELINQLNDRRYPYTVRGTAEIAVSADFHLLDCIGKDIREDNLLRDDIMSVLDQDFINEYSCGVSEIYYYAEKTYALGTATREFHAGSQTDSIHLTYDNGGDACVMFANYNINEINSIKDMGRKIAFQEKNTALVLYCPINNCEKEVEFAGLNLFLAIIKKQLKR